MISCIIPAFNASCTIKKAIKSVQSQTYSDFELIIVDDGSYDNTLDICIKLMQKDHRIKVIHQENNGSIKARFEGIRHAKGEYVFFLDADDWINRYSFEKLVSASKKDNADVIVAHGYRVAKRIHFIKRKFKFFYNKPRLWNEQMLKPYNNVYIPQIYTNNLWGRLYRKSLFDEFIDSKYNPLDIHYGDDRYTNFLISPKIKSIELLDEYLYYYRHGGSVSGYNPRQWTDYIKLFNFQIEYAKEYCPPYINFMIGQRNRVFNQHIINMIFAKIPENEILHFIKDNIQCNDQGAKEILSQVKKGITIKLRLKKWIISVI